MAQLLVIFSVFLKTSQTIRISTTQLPSAHKVCTYLPSSIKTRTAPRHTLSTAVTISINLNSPTNKMKSQEVSIKGQPHSQPAKVEQQRAEPKTNPAASKKEPAKSDQKIPMTPRNKKETDKCPRCGRTGFLAQCHSCSLGTGVGL